MALWCLQPTQKTEWLQTAQSHLAGYKLVADPSYKCGTCLGNINAES